MKKIIILVALLVLALFLSKRIFGTNSNLAEGVSSKKITEIEIGMTKNDVFKIIGKPLEIQNKTTFVYSKPVKYSRNYPMLWVHFDENQKVREVLAKRYIYFGCDDEGIYGVSKSNKPWIVDQSVLNDCFH